MDGVLVGGRLFGVGDVDVLERFAARYEGLVHGGGDEDVLVHKLIAWSEKDQDDIESILSARPTFDQGDVGRWAELWQVAERFSEAQEPLDAELSGTRSAHDRDPPMVSGTWLPSHSRPTALRRLDDPEPTSSAR